MLIKLTHTNYKEILEKAVDILTAGGVIAYPTETLYGLGARYDIEQALERIFELKKRPEEKALTLIIGNNEQLSLIANSVSDIAKELINLYWPGPLTLVFKARDDISKHLKLDDTVAVRIPGDSFALRLARSVPFPITATSANISKMPSAQDAETVLNYFNDNLDLIIDGGKTAGEPPSTIVDVTGNEARLIRAGAVDISKFLKR